MMKRIALGALSLMYLAISIALSGCEPKPKNGFAQLLVSQGTKVTKPANLQFPADHGGHPDFGIEWWYLTANLTDKTDNPIWLQWTLFRTLAPQPENTWSNGQFYMAHFSIHSETQHIAREKFAQGGVGNVGVNSDLMFIDDWQLSKNLAGRPSALTLSIPDDVELDLSFNAKQSVLLQGDEGYSEKYPNTGLASYYYSVPDIQVNGQIKLKGQHHSVKGHAWYDHEWSSAFLNEHFTGWQWFSLHLEDNTKLMLFTLQPTKASELAQYWYGKYRKDNEETVSLTDNQIHIVPLQYIDSKMGKIAIEWRLQIPTIHLDVTIHALKREQISPFSVLYYEGAVNVSGSTNGVGFVEMTQ